MDETKIELLNRGISRLYDDLELRWYPDRDECVVWTLWCGNPAMGHVIPKLLCDKSVTEIIEYVIEHEERRWKEYSLTSPLRKRK